MGNITKAEFEFILQVLVAGLAEKIRVDLLVCEEEALEKLYATELYAALKNEETKVWHYSVTMLYELYKVEIETGKLEIPDYFLYL